MATVTVQHNYNYCNTFTANPMPSFSHTTQWTAE